MKKQDSLAILYLNDEDLEGEEEDWEYLINQERRLAWRRAKREEHSGVWRGKPTTGCEEEVKIIK